MNEMSNGMCTLAAVAVYKHKQDTRGTVQQWEKAFETVWQAAQAVVMWSHLKSTVRLVSQ